MKCSTVVVQLCVYYLPSVFSARNISPVALVLLLWRGDVHTCRSADTLSKFCLNTDILTLTVTSQNVTIRLLVTLSSWYCLNPEHSDSDCDITECPSVLSNIPSPGYVVMVLFESNPPSWEEFSSVYNLLDYFICILHRSNQKGSLACCWRICSEFKC